MKRHQLILDKLNHEHHVEVSDLCEELKVSAVTIRKDLKLLEDKGLLYRIHGGASLENPYINDRPINEKEKISVSEKSDISKKAAELIKDNDSIMIASGTTVQQLARSITNKGSLNVITSSLNVALELLNHQNIQVIQLGGNLRHSSSSVTGHYAQHILEHISCSLLFLGVDGIDLDYGCTTTSLEEALLNQKMMEASQRTIILADSSKFGKKSFGRICGLEQVDQVITDSGISPNLAKKIKDLGVKLSIV
ncbi:MAG: DeoR/GlpR transcriptional regulator [Zunongwangia sp.]|uniref:Transcriptional regulator, GlpR family protein n=2 Tax=Zunongwangia profunda TaxID=398743 RepID=D5BGF6_ZUNPS|nr:DeoR/GlpR family DNA-binding transcription regulator [Zunongwangia profunda]MAC65652.1 DeoR/GlpR transcriptional regulator [Flavobacteriaceae bacterium]MAO35619.1 DeoR/GlpR transcriptional regulator [Zunongwangia sp.]ADF51115.1 transcriptional regulator, GlpR family protein [Zunongwangia profunda SM-A87]MAO38272.1 DeoR/GlpR transcriptional regulator [Zunongwangia sp.]MAS72913.1 DeoR/GlpR transcriptional regulator [Zunongwangia sp.]|tara:strand:- start:691 stop:1443 length:753 start_codon:yes stop_codon:yes gene_type:complete